MQSTYPCTTTCLLIVKSTLAVAWWKQAREVIDLLRIFFTCGMVLLKKIINCPYICKWWCHNQLIVSRIHIIIIKRKIKQDISFTCGMVPVKKKRPTTLLFSNKKVVVLHIQLYLIYTVNKKKYERNLQKTSIVVVEYEPPSRMIV